MEKPRVPKCKNGTRKYKKYGDECLTEEEYKNRLEAEEERKQLEKRKTKKNKVEPSLMDSIMNVAKTLTGQDDADKADADRRKKMIEDEEARRKAKKEARAKAEAERIALEEPKVVDEAVLKEEVREEPKVVDKAALKEEVREVEAKEILKVAPPPPPPQNINSNPSYLYPSLNDPHFNQKIAHRNEFESLKYVADITKPLKQTSNLICKNPEFELLNHQLFVKTFISQNTPYKSILLYHGLGSGKTCSAIGIAEEMRDYMKSIGITQRIIVIASSNVQDNFRLQLFDERRLEQDPVTETWSSRSCIGNKLIREINPVGAKMTREKIISHARTIINTSYEFKGYLQFANNIHEHVYESIDEDDPNHDQIEVQNIRRYYSNRLIVIDEVHNCTKEDKRLAKLLLKIATHAENLRFVLLSATPMYNSPREIIWLCNLLNINDGRSTISYDEVFSADGEMRNPDLLRQKLNGYVSYVRGENPYTFPFRIYPDAFAPENEARAAGKAAGIINKLYYTKLHPYQQESYEMVVRDYIGDSGKIDMEDENYGYAQLQMPLQALIMTFHRVNETDAFIGKEGLANNMSFVEKSEKKGDVYEFRKYNYEYKKGVPRIFHETELPKYSSKIADICSTIRKSRGIIIVYTQYIDGGIVAVSLALEEMGFTRYGTSQTATPLFKPGAIDSVPIDATTMMPADPANKKFNQAKYMILSGDKFFSQNNAADIKYATSEANKNGELVRVILISRAASEGLDFKYVRQVHILDPWYNLNRIEQIIGRGVRNQSHCGLEFEERNVEIYLHAAIPDGDTPDGDTPDGDTPDGNTPDGNTPDGDTPDGDTPDGNTPDGDTPDGDTFCADLYLYRYAERKALMIGKVTRLLKTISVDCVLNHSQTNFTDINMEANGNVLIRSSTMEEPQYFLVGDKSKSYACDYMDDCDYKCFPEDKIEAPKEGYVITKPSSFIIQKMMDRISALIGRETTLHFNALEKMLGMPSKYDLYFALTELIENPIMTFTDKYGRVGRLVNRDKYYLFQPIEVTDPHSSVFDSMVPVQVKAEKVRLGIPNVINELEPVRAETQAKTNAFQPVNEEHLEARRIIGEIEMLVTKAIGEPIEIESNDEDWYNHMSNYKAVSTKKKPKDMMDYTALKMLARLHNIEVPELTLYIWNHALNTLEYKDRIILAKWAFSKSPKTSELEKHVVSYFEYLVFDMEGDRGILIANNDDNILFDLLTWKEMPYKHETFDPVIRARFYVEPTDFPKIVGFFGGFKTGVPVFKIKQLLLKRNNPGAYLMNEAKGDIITLLNSVLKYAHANVEYEAEVTTKMTKVALGIILEIVMQSITSEENVWFMRQEKANYNKIQKLKL